MPPTRRQFALGLLAAAALPAAARAALTGWPELDGPPLRARAAAKGLLFGSAVQQNQLARDPGFAAVVRREAAIVTPEFELKWASVRPTPSEDRFAEPDRLLEWCAAQGLRMRGHALVWHEALPAWVPRFIDAPAARLLLTEHITKLVRRYAGRLHSWDVVNEAIEPKHGRGDGLRVSVWQAALGPEYIDLAFRAAAAADPSVPLYYNEYGLDCDTPEDEARRRATLGLLERLRARGVPVHGLGIQGHLAGAGKAFDAGRFNRFLDQVAALGYRIMITELDVTDNKLPADIAARDGAIAALTADYLAVACAHPAVDGVVSWGLSDRQTWLNTYPDYKRADGLPQRPLPLDAALQRKPMWAAIARALDRAPDHRIAGR
jgi:endo-1,4-beta-xylanase